MAYVRLTILLCGFSLLAGADSRPLELVQRLPHSGYSEGLSFYEGRLWHALPKKIVVIDPATGKVMESHQPATSYSESLTWFQGKLWNVSFADNGLYVSEKGTPLSFRRVGNTPEKHAWGLTHDGTHLILTGNYSSRLYFIEPNTAKVVRVLEVPVKDLEDLAWDGYGLWTSSFTEHKGKIFRVDPRTGNVQKMFALPDPAACPVVDGIAYHRNLLYVTGKNCPSIWVLRKPSEKDILRTEPERAISRKKNSEPPRDKGKKVGSEFLR